MWIREALLQIYVPGQQRIEHSIVPGIQIGQFFKQMSKEIASELGLAVNTIHAHRKNLMAKLSIHKETELVRYALREGIAKL